VGVLWTMWKLSGVLCVFCFNYWYQMKGTTIVICEELTIQVYSKKLIIFNIFGNRNNQDFFFRWSIKYRLVFWIFSEWLIHLQSYCFRNKENNKDFHLSETRFNRHWFFLLSSSINLIFLMNVFWKWPEQPDVGVTNCHCWVIGLNLHPTTLLLVMLKLRAESKIRG
jgi:hypothetical protein